MGRAWVAVLSIEQIENISGLRNISGQATFIEQPEVDWPKCLYILQVLIIFLAINLTTKLINLA